MSDSENKNVFHAKVQPLALALIQAAGCPEYEGNDWKQG